MPEAVQEGPSSLVPYSFSNMGETLPSASTFCDRPISVLGSQLLFLRLPFMSQKADWMLGVNLLALSNPGLG